jgi:hypothetical protein
MTQAFTKKQLTIIFKIAFLEAMALSIIMPSVTSSGEIPGLTTESGTATASFLGNDQSASTNIIFPTIFSATPRVTTQLKSFGSLSNVNTGSLSFLSSGTPITWLNMPTIETEFLGNVNNELQLTFFSATGITFLVDCPTRSTGTGANLNVEYSTNQATWISLVVNITIDNSSSCNTMPTLSSSSGIPTSVLGTSIFLRVVGEKGNGVGDSPTFTQIHLLTRSQSIDTYNIVTTLVSNTGFTLTVQRQFKSIGSANINVFWQAELS